MSLASLRLLLVSLGILFVLGTAWALRYFTRSQGLTPFAQSYLQPGMGGVALEALDVHVVGHDHGRRRWRMTADAITFSRDRRTATVLGIRQGTLLDDRGRPTATVTAANAVYSSPFGGLDAAGSGVLTLSGHVRAVVLTAQRPVLLADTLVWNVPRSELTSPAPLTALLPRLQVTAGRALYTAPPGKPDLGRLQLSGGVRARFQSTRGLTTLTCPGLVWNAAQNTARSLGPVQATIPGGLGAASAADVVVNTKTGSLQGHGFQGSMGVGGLPN